MVRPFPKTAVDLYKALAMLYPSYHSDHNNQRICDCPFSFTGSRPHLLNTNPTSTDCDKYPRQQIRKTNYSSLSLSLSLSLFFFFFLSGGGGGL